MKPNVLLSKKLKDFTYWATLVNIYYLGYHTLPEGLALMRTIKLHMNKRKAPLELDNNIDRKTTELFNTPSPYVIKNGIRYIQNTDKLVPERFQISADLGNELRFNSITECSGTLGIERAIIKNCVLSGAKHKGYKFVANKA